MALIDTSSFLPAAAGTQIEFFIAGTNTSAVLFADPNLQEPLASSFQIGADGYPIDPNGSGQSIFHLFIGPGQNVDVAMGRGRSNRRLTNIAAYPASSGLSGAIEAQLILSPQHFGAKGDGVALDTDAIRNWINRLIVSGAKGYWPQGTYRVELGKLVFDAQFTNKQWPDIQTAGVEKVFLKAYQNINAPFLYIHNGEANSDAGRYWMGGSIGGLTFLPASGNRDIASGVVGDCPNMHGIVLRGVQYTKFGQIRGTDIGGDTIRCERKLYQNYNPDPYHVAGCFFDAVEGLRNYGRAFTNDNYVGFNGNQIRFLRAIETQKGGYFGLGSGNKIDVMSVGSCAGWALGDAEDAVGGSSSRFILGAAEFDNVEYGINCNQAISSDFGLVRFIHRRKFTPNQTNSYWPRQALKIGDGRRGISDISIHIIDRLEASNGARASDLGAFADFTNSGSNLANISITRRFLDNANLNPPRGAFITNGSLIAGVNYDLNGAPLQNSDGRYASLAKARASGNIGNVGFGTPQSLVRFDTPLLGCQPGPFDGRSFTYTAPMKGYYRTQMRLIMQTLPGVRVRVGLLKNGELIAVNMATAPDGNKQAYQLDETILLDIGDRLSIVAEQNSRQIVPLSNFASNNDNFWLIMPI